MAEGKVVGTPGAMAEATLDAQVHLAARLGLGCAGNFCVFLLKVRKKE
jgi:hypothetical protein